MTTTADDIAERAYQAVKDYPAYDAEDRVAMMLEHMRPDMDDLHADVIAACRRKAGIA